MTLGLQVRGTQIFHNGALIRGVGVNHFSAFLDRYGAPVSTGLSYDSDGALALAKSVGCPFIRCSFGMLSASQWHNQYYLDKARYYGVVDGLVAKCESLGLGIIVNQVWDGREFAKWALLRYGTVGVPADYGIPGSNVWNMQEELISEFVDRYKNSPAIWGWQFCNESTVQLGVEYWRGWSVNGTTPSWADWGNKIDSPATPYAVGDKLLWSGYLRWAQRTRDLYKRYDPHARMVLSGDHNGATFGASAKVADSYGPDTLAQWNGTGATEHRSFFDYINGPFDVVCSHTYGKATGDGLYFSGNDLTNTQFVNQLASWSATAGKPLFMEEFGASRYAALDSVVSPNEAAERANFEQLLAAILSNNIQLSAVWNLVGNISAPPELDWQRWSLVDPSRSYQLDAIAATNAAF